MVFLCVSKVNTLIEVNLQRFLFLLLFCSFLPSVDTALQLWHSLLRRSQMFQEVPFVSLCFFIPVLLVSNTIYILFNYLSSICFSMFSLQHFLRSFCNCILKGRTKSILSKFLPIVYIFVLFYLLIY